MRGVMAALGAVLFCSGVFATAPAPAEAEEIEEFTLGQWAGYSYVNDETGQFTDCTIWALNRKNIQLGVSVLKDWSLELWLNSKAWDLPANKSYPISYWIDRNRQYSGRAKTYAGKYVIIQVERDQDVYDELKAGNQVTFRTLNEDYMFGLSGSRAALTRLLDCVDQHAKSVSANPFGGASGNQQKSGGQQGGGFESANQSGSNGGASSGTSMKSFTMSSAEVRAFLVDVTGAKPSMISVDEKADKNGVPYYALKTPLGDGEFWQEKLGGRDLGGIASSYIEDYKKDCSGTFEPVVSNPVRGDHGAMVAGGAACSSSKYQDNGPEYLSYSVVERSGVVSFYMTYVGGNAAKAKSDSLGKLIARRSEEIVQ